MVKKLFSLMLALVVLFACVPMVAQALPDNIVLDAHGADGDTSNTSSDYWTDGNALWADKSVFDNGDGSMNVLISLQARQVDGGSEGEPVGAVIDGDLVVNDVLGNGFAFGDSISINLDTSYVYSVSGGWSGTAPDGVSVSVNGNSLSVSINGDQLLIAGGTASISYVANCSATTAGTYYVSAGCTVTASGAMADRSDSFAKSSDVVQDGSVACTVEISGGNQTSELGNNGYVTLSEIQYYTDSYQYDGDYPSEVMSTLPSGGAQYVSGATATAVAPSETSIRGSKDGQDGTWTFNGWDANEKTVENDVVFVGTWSFEPDPTAYYEVYRYDGVTDENVLATLPSGSEPYYNGNTVIPKSPSAEVVMTDAGTYIFNGWSPESVMIADGDAVFTGTWLFEPKAEEPEPEPTKVHVVYEYTGVTVDAVLATLPTDDTEYDVGAEITAILPNPATVETDDGAWVFDGWTRADGENVVFTGTWTFHPKQAETVIIHAVYEYADVTDESVLATLPSDSTEYASFSDVIAITPDPSEIVVETGTWTFNGWNRAESEGLVTFTGTWTFVAKQEDPSTDPIPTYTVTYTYQDVDDENVMATLPVDTNEYVSGASVTAITPSAVEVNILGGVWVFNGWDAEAKQIESENIVFVGTWTFNPAQVDPDSVSNVYHIVYQYDNVTLDAILDTLPIDTMDYTAGALVMPQNPSALSVEVSDGTWTFDGWQPSNIVIEGSDGTFVGTWTFVEKTSDPEPVTESHYVIYMYDGITDFDVWATAPEDDTAYAVGTNVMALMPSSTEVTTSAGTFFFNGWDASVKEMGHEDLTFTGTWTFVASDDQGGSDDPEPQVDPTVKYHVSYVYNDVTDADVVATLPVDTMEYDVGSQIVPDSPSSTLLLRDDGMWSFRGWDATLKIIENADITFTGTWEFIPNEPEYSVTYSYTGFDELPAEIKNTLPVDANHYRSGATVVAILPSVTEMEVDSVPWQFDGWDTESKAIIDENIVFTGSWSVVSSEPEVKYQVIYEYDGFDGLPANVQATLPVDAHTYDSGTTVIAAAPSLLETEVDGILWSFNGWDASQKQIVDANVVFIGSWRSQSSSEPEKQYYGEHYMYSGSVGEAVLATLPTRVGAYENGTTVVPAQPTSSEVVISGGKWVFVGWDADAKVINNGDVTFYGEWNFVPITSYYGEHYVYEDVTDVDVLATLPTRQGAYENGSQVFPVNPSSETVITEDGTWTFIGWTPTVATVLNGDVTFYGKWSFVAKEIPTYSEVYQYSNITDEAVLATLPTRKGTYYNGDSVVPAQPLVTTVTVENGVYTFNGWDTASRIVTDADVVFTGTWTFVENVGPTKYSERYAYANVTEPLVLATLPTRAEKYDVGVLVIPAQPSATSISLEDGVWTFDGWDVAGRVVIDQDVSFIGTWTFKANEDPVPPPTVYYGEHYVYTDADSLPDEVNATIPLRTGSYVPGDVVVPAQPSATVVTVTNGEWSFLGWDADTKTIVDADITFIGSWTFTEKETPPEPPVVYYKESYQYDKEYPEAIMATLPTRHGQYVDGDVVEAASPTETSIVGVQGNVDGTWTFGGWDESKKTINKADIVFIGTWNFTPKDSHQKYTEFYRYDKDYPDEVMATLPLSARMFENGTTVIPVNPTASLVEGEVDGQVGVWKFDGWDEPQKIVSNAAVIFVGSWTFEEEASYRTNVTLKTVWIDNNNASKLRPENIAVTLYADGEVMLNLNLAETQNYQAVFENLPAKKDGIDIVYSVSEDIPEGYALSLTSKYVASSIDEPGSIEFILTNTLVDQGIALPETGSMNALWITLGGMLLALIGLILFWPKRKHE